MEREKMARKIRQSKIVRMNNGTQFEMTANKNHPNQSDVRVISANGQYVSISINHLSDNRTVLTVYTTTRQESRLELDLVGMIPANENPIFSSADSESSIVFKPESPAPAGDSSEPIFPDAEKVLFADERINDRENEIRERNIDEATAGENDYSGDE